jgi:hypothetical protein
MKISNEVINFAKDQGLRLQFNRPSDCGLRGYTTQCGMNEATHFELTGWSSDGEYYSYRIKGTKKPYTMRQLLSKIDKDNIYVSFVETFKAISSLQFWIYPTTYGVGVMTMDKERLEKTIVKVLEENKIEYRTEYSEASYVYRFIISKSAENIKKIKSIKAN